MPLASAASIGPQTTLRADDGRDFVAAVVAREVDGELAGRQLGAGNHGRERVENHVLRFLDDGVGQRRVRAASAM